MNKVLGNDILLVVKLTQKINGIISDVDLTTIKDYKLTIINGNLKAEKPFIVRDNKLVIELKGNEQRLGAVSMVFVWSDYNNHQFRYASDTLLNFVSRTSQANNLPSSDTDDTEIDAIEINATYLKALKGDKGDPLTYEDLTVEQINDLQRPATIEAERIALIENARSAEENKRIVSESVRKDNELTRQDSEVLRVDNETTRNNNETARQQAEENRAQAEDTRIANEDRRVTAENKRIDAEVNRNSTEQERISAEHLREQAEVNRDNAEQERAIALLNCNKAIKNAEDKASEAKAQGEYAEAQGNYAKEATTSCSEATTEANKAKEACNTATVNAEEATDKCTDKLNELEDITDLVHEAPKDGKQYARENGEWSEVEGGTSNNATPKIYTISGDFIKVPLTDANNWAIQKDWVSFMWDDFSSTTSNSSFIISRISQGSKTVIQLYKSGSDTALTIGIKKIKLLNGAEAPLQSRHNIMCINFYTNEVIVYQNGVLKCCKNITDDWSCEEIPDTSMCDNLYLGLENLNNKSSIIMLNCKVDEDMAKEIFNNGLFYLNQLPSKYIGDSFYPEKYGVDGTVGNNATFEKTNDGGIGNFGISSNSYFTSKNGFSDLYQYRNVDYYCDLHILSGKIQLIGFSVNGNVKITSVTNDIGEHIDATSEIGLGDYKIKGYGVTRKPSIYLLNFKVIENASVQISNVETRIKGSVLKVIASEIVNNDVIVNNNQKTPFLGIPFYNESVCPVVYVESSPNKYTKTDYVGQMCVDTANGNVYTSTTFDNTTWKKITQ